MVSLLKLSNREAQILLRVFEDMKESAIAMDLGISTHTVHTHFERMYRKLGVGDRCSLVICVFETYVGLKVRSPHFRLSTKHAHRVRGRRDENAVSPG